MDIDQEKVEQTVLSLLYLTSFKDKFWLRTWKEHDWQVMNSLHEKGYISNPATKAKSVALKRGGSQTISGFVRKTLRNEMRAVHFDQSTLSGCPRLGVGTSDRWLGTGTELWLQTLEK